MKKSLLLVGALSMAAFGTAQADEALATKSGCTACHQIEAKVVGPAYKDVAAKYKGDAGAVDALTAKVIAGSSGVWGPVPMPPKGGRMDVSDDDIRAVVEWVLSL